MNKVRGFTLIELLVVLIILAVIAGSTLVWFGSRIQTTEDKQFIAKFVQEVDEARDIAIVEGAVVRIKLNSQGFQLISVKIHDNQPKQTLVRRYENSTFKIEPMTITAFPNGTLSAFEAVFQSIASKKQYIVKGLENGQISFDIQS